MAIARPKFNINLIMVVNMPFLFAGKEYVKGNIFDKDSCAMKQTRGLFNARRLRSPNDPLCPKMDNAGNRAAKKAAKPVKAKTKVVAKPSAVKAASEAATADSHKKSWE